MPRIWVCGLDAMPDLVERVRPGRLISLLPADDQPATPLQVRASDHLRLLVDDVDRPEAGFVAPARAHLEQLIAFLRASPPRASLVIHCLAGVSRSTAAALVALALDAPGREREAAESLRRAAPFACPNRLIVRLADDALARKGALSAALDAMGAPVPTSAFFAFHLDRGV
jgi:predicted protein tyrosine phosphatase